MRGKLARICCSVGVSVFIFARVAVAQQTQPNAAAPVAQTTPAPAAATAPAPTTLEEVTVTGSRIRRKDLTASSPLVTIDSSQLESRAGLNIESYLNQLPQYNTAQSPVTEPNDVQPSAVNTVGISSISLRGLGPNRGLVLIDGHRTTPANALLVTDINTIPESMIDHVEIITGGASAVYGADAMSGVTNFITKKNFEGSQIDVQDSVTEAGDGNETRVNGLMGTKISDGKGTILMGVEYYNREAAYQKNRDFFTDAWSDPNALTGNALFVQGFNGYEAGYAVPSQTVVNALFPARAATGQSVCTYFTFCFGNSFYFNPNGSLFSTTLPIAQSGFTGDTTSPTTNGGYGVVNAYDAAFGNPMPDGSAPPEIQTLRWNNPYAQVSIPQTRYSFFANGTYDVTDTVQFYMTSRFADSLTTTQLSTPTTSIYGWEAVVPFNEKTDSPINPADLGPTSSAATVAAIVAAFQANPNCASVSCNKYYNPNFIAANTPGAQHPVPWQLAALLLSRSQFLTGAPAGSPIPGVNSAYYDGPVSCNNSISTNLTIDCAGGANEAPTSWILNYLPQWTAPQRTTLDQDVSFQIQTGFRFPLFGDWMGDLYYSRGQTLDYEQGLGNLSLERFRSVIAAPDYGGNGDAFQGNAQGASPFFGTSVPSYCTGGMYETIFSGFTAPSSNCLTTFGSVLQTYLGVQQDDAELDINGTLFKLPAGDVSAALGGEFRRDAAQFQPDNLQSTYSFLDQSIGLYPLGVTNNEIYDHDGYAEFFIPLLSDVQFFQKLSLDIGGRYSVFSNNIPDAKTYKITPDWQITKSFRIRGGYNHAVRAPNLGELYLGEQEIFGVGAVFGDPCSVPPLRLSVPAALLPISARAARLGRRIPRQARRRQARRAHTSSAWRRWVARRRRSRLRVWSRQEPGRRATTMEPRPVCSARRLRHCRRHSPGPIRRATRT